MIGGSVSNSDAVAKDLNVACDWVMRVVRVV
jgi:hypothetical protein